MLSRPVNRARFARADACHPTFYSSGFLARGLRLPPVAGRALLPQPSLATLARTPLARSEVSLRLIFRSPLALLVAFLRSAARVAPPAVRDQRTARRALRASRTATLNRATSLRLDAPRWQSPALRGGLQSRYTPVQIRPLALLIRAVGEHRVACARQVARIEERRRFEPWRTQPGTARRAARPDRLSPVQIRPLACNFCYTIPP